MLHGVLWRPGRRAGPREVDNGGFVSVVLVTGSAGLIGSEAVRHFAGLGLDIVGIDNDMRARFFGPEASTAWNVQRLRTEPGGAYAHHAVDSRARHALAQLFTHYARAVVTGDH